MYQKNRYQKRAPNYLLGSKAAKVAAAEAKAGLLNKLAITLRTDSTTPAGLSAVVGGVNQAIPASRREAMRVATGGG